MSALATETAPGRRARHRLRRISPETALVLAGLLFLVLQLTLFPRPFGLSTDEATYLAKVDPSALELYWNPQRAWGVPVLAAPVGVFSASVEVVRVYFAVLSSVALVVAFWPWLRVLERWVAPLAALLFGTTWFTLFFGPQVMPNLWVALTAVAAVGFFLRGAGGSGRRHVVLAGVAAALLALVRPTDSVLVVVPVLASALVVPRLRRPAPMAALVVGGVVGWLPWIVEAFLRFGGPLTRLRAAAETGPQGLSFSTANLLAFPRLLDGAPLYFSRTPPAQAGPLQTVFVLWVAALVVLVVLGIPAAAAQRRLPEILTAVLPAALLAVFYLTVTEVTALRFVLPVIALLSLPVATALVQAVRMTRGRARTLVVVAVAAGVLTDVAGMATMNGLYAAKSAVGRDDALAAADLLRPHVERRHCMLLGEQPQATAYYLGCAVESAHGTAAPPARVTAARRAGWDVLALLPKAPKAGSYLARWRPADVDPLPGGLRAYAPPS
jgi:hypothetical protein